MNSDIQILDILTDTLDEKFPKKVVRRLNQGKNYLCQAK